jgi:hypothetical protein
MILGVPVNAATDTAAHEARISELEAKVERLEALLEERYRELDQSCARTEDVEEALATCASIEQVEEALADPADHPTLYNETEIKVGGYVKMDGLLSDYSEAPTRGVGEDLFIPETIETSGESRDPRLNFHARESRFWLRTFTPTERGDITTHFEIDFLLGQQGNERVSNSFSPRGQQFFFSSCSTCFDQLGRLDRRTNLDQFPEYVDASGIPGFRRSGRRDIWPSGTDSLHRTHRER